MKKIPLLTLILIVFLLTGCAGKGETTPLGSAHRDTTAGSATPTDFPDTENAEVTLVENPDDTLDCKPLIQGSVSFDEDSSNQASMELLADGKEKPFRSKMAKA